MHGLAGSLYMIDSLGNVVLFRPRSACTRVKYVPYLYSEYFFSQIFRNKNDGSATEYIWGGGRPNGIPADCGTNHNIPCANGVSPLVIDPNPNHEQTLLAGGISLWQTVNARTDAASDVCWREIKSPLVGGDYIAAIAVAEGDSDLIWVGYNRSSVFYTTTGTLGTSTTPCPLSSPRPSWSPGDPSNTLPSNRPLTSITIGHPQSEPPEAFRTVYVTYGQFFPTTTDTRGNVWKRESNGNWTDIHQHPNGQHPLPRTPVYSLVISPSNPNFLYVGTEVGIFASADGGMNWSPAFGGSASDLIFSLVSSTSASEPDIVYVGTDAGVFATADEGATWVPGFGGPANTRVATLFWMINGPTRKLVVATHGRGMFTLTATN